MACSRRPDSYAPLLDIPDKLDDVIKMHQQKNYAGHPGLLAALKSSSNKRSPKRAYILLLGSTGAGKSSAINILFNNKNITQVGEANSTTTDICEFRISVPIDELGIANSELIVIDTPGLADTRGLEQDAQFLATLDSFLANHEDLKDRIPNIVVVCHKFTDNRFAGDNSQYTKMLRGFDSFRERITDENYSNVIFLLSHFCSERPDIQRAPTKRLDQFKEVIEDFTLFPKPTHITVAENLADVYELPMVDGYYKLPNNIYYPKNLFDKFRLATEKGGDPIGLGVFSTAFRNADNFEMKPSSFKLVGKECQRIKFYLSILTNIQIGIQDTEISQLLAQVWNEDEYERLRQKFPSSLPYLQKTLNMRNVNTLNDVPKTSTAVLELLTAIKQDEATRVLLEKALNIKPPVFLQNTVAGFSYNVFQDAYLPKSPFEMGHLQQTDIGFLIPNILTCELERATSENFFIFDTKEKYVQHRLQSLGIAGTIPSESFTGATKSGHNIKETSFKENSCSLSATREFRLFEFNLNDRLEFTEEFKAVVTSLPPFDEKDHENVAKWTNFFNEYGTHVVKSIYGGGAIEIQLQSDKPFSSDLTDALFDVIKFAEDISSLIHDNEDPISSTSGLVNMKEGISHSLTFVGGDPAYHTSDLTKMPFEQARNLLKNWKKSLKFSPIVLGTKMKLAPISQFVKQLGQNYASEMDKATSLLFKSELKYVPPVINQGSGGRREDTPMLTALLVAQQEANQKIQEAVIEMRKMEMENMKRRQEMDEKQMLWEQDRRREDQEYKREQAELQDKREARREERLHDMEARRQLQEVKMAEEQRRYQEKRDAEMKQQMLQMEAQRQQHDAKLAEEQRKFQLKIDTEREKRMHEIEIQRQQHEAKMAKERQNIQELHAAEREERMRDMENQRQQHEARLDEAQRKVEAQLEAERVERKREEERQRRQLEEKMDEEREKGKKGIIRKIWGVIW